MSREAEFRQLAAKHDLVDARLCGDAIVLSASDYWKWANMVAPSFVRPSTDWANFLRDIEGFALYLDGGLAGTGLTIETELDLPGYLAKIEAT